MIRKVVIPSGLFQIARPASPTAVDRDEAAREPVRKCCEKSPLEKPASHPLPPVQPDDPLAYCDHCKAWHPMKWLPLEERGKRAEVWFQCAVCGGRSLTLRYLSPGEALA